MNVVKIVMNGPVLGRGNLINKLTVTEQQHKVTNERPPKLYIAIQALDKRKGKKKKGTCFNSDTGHFAKECCSKPKRTPEERANKVIGGRTEFVFTTQLGGSQPNKSNTWILDSGASRHMVSSKIQLIKAKPLEIPTIVVLGVGQSLKATHPREAIIPQDVRLTDVLYILGLKENLFLVSMASALSRAKIVMKNGSCQVMKDGRVALSAKKRGGVF